MPGAPLEWWGRNHWTLLSPSKHFTDDKFLKIISVPEGSIGPSIINLHPFLFAVIPYSYYLVVPTASPPTWPPKTCGYMFCHWFIYRPKVSFPVLSVVQILTLPLINKDVLFKEISWFCFSHIPLSRSATQPTPWTISITRHFTTAKSAFFFHFYSRKLTIDFPNVNQKNQDHIIYKKKKKTKKSWLKN